MAQEVRGPQPQLAELKALQRENRRLKKTVADRELGKLILKESLDFLQAEGLRSDGLGGALVHGRQKLGTGQRRTCKILGLARSTLRHRSKQQNDDDLRLAPIQLAKQYGR